MPPRSPHIILCWKCRIFKGIGAALGATWPLTQCGMAISGSAIVCWWHTPFPGWYTIPARSQSPMILGGLQVASYQRSDKNHDIRCGMVLTHIHKKYKKGWVNNRLHKNLSLYPCTARAKRFRYSTSTCKESILQLPALFRIPVQFQRRMVNGIDTTNPESRTPWWWMDVALFSGPESNLICFECGHGF